MTLLAVAEPVAPLSRLELVKQMLAEATTVDEIKDIRDKAEAARMYAKEAKLGLEAQNYAAEVKVRAERRAGEMLAAMDKHGGGRPFKETSSTVPQVSPPTLADLGIDRTQASRWQRVAAVPEAEFEAHVEAFKAGGRELTTTSVMRLLRTSQQPIDPAAQSVPEVIAARSDKTRAGVAARHERIRELAQQGYREDVIAEKVGMSMEGVRAYMHDHGIPTVAQKMGRAMPRLDSNRIMEGIVNSAQPADEAVAAINWEALDSERRGDWVARLNQAIRDLTSLRNRLREG